MYSWEEGPPSDFNPEEESYYQWLDENCKCHLTDEECTCLCFEDWLDDKEADYWESFLDEDLA